MHTWSQSVKHRCVVPAILVGVFSAPLVGQFQSPRSLGTAMMLPTPPREIKQALSRAKRAIDEEQYSDAVEALVELLGTPGNEDFFVETNDKQRRQSLKSTARDLLGELPKVGLDIYELQYGVEARQLLDQAVDARDIEALTDVSRRFFHTGAGYDATFLLGQYYLDQQRPLAAAMTLARLMDHPTSARRYGTELRLLLALSWRLAGNPEVATEVLHDLKRASRDVVIRVADREVPLFADNVDPLVWLDEVIGNRAVVAFAAAEQWAVFRGDAARNSSTRGGMPLPGLQWRVDVCPESVEDEAIVRRVWKASLDSEKALIPALHPLAVGDYVLMRTIDGIYGVDVDSGKRIWPFPWFQAHDSASVPSSTVRQFQPHNRETQRANELQQRIWSDLTQGQLSSDGTCVFAVYGSKNQVASQRMMFGRGFNRRGVVRPGNQLVALELATQGKIRWLLGGDDGDLPELKDAFFMGPPLPLGDRLYVVTELKDEIKLLVLDAESGAIVWSQQLGHIDLPYQNVWLQGRRLIGASPSFADGILVCPTSAGAAVAVDLATRSLVWGYEYKQMIRNRFSSSSVVNRSSLRANPQWADGSVAIHQGHVVMTPIEAGSLICLGLLSGKPVWNPLPQGDGVYLAGIHQGVIVVVEKKRVRGIRLNDGKEAWDEPLAIPGNAMPSGRGFVSDGDYFLPTTADQVVRFHMVDGTIVEVVDSEYPLGNLVCYRDKVLSQTPDGLYAFYQRERMRELIPQRLAEAPNDPRTLEDNARLLVNDGEYETAIQQLRRALQLYDNDSPHKLSAKSLLVSVMLNGLRQDFDRLDYRNELEQIIDDPRQRIEFYRISVAGLLERDQRLDAFNVLLRLAQMEVAESGDLDDTSSLERVSSQHRVRLDVWLRSQLAALLAAATEAERDVMQDRITERLDRVRQSPDSTARRRFVELFFGSPQAVSLLSDLTNEQIAAERFLSAERWLTYLQTAGSASQALAASMRLVNLYQSRLRFDDVHDLLARVDRDWPNVRDAKGQTGSELAAARLAHLEQVGGRVPGKGMTELRHWPLGRVELSNQLPNPASRRPTAELLSIDLREVRGQWNPNHRLVYDRNGHKIMVLDGHGIAQVSVPARGQRPLGYHAGNHNLIQAKLYGHLLVVSLGYEILAINLLDDVEGRPEDRVLWRTALTPQDAARTMATSTMIGADNHWTIERMVPVDKNGRRVGILGPVEATGVCFQKNSELRCVDPMTGHIRWVRKGIRHSCDLFGDEEYVFVVPPKSGKASVYAMSDGTLLGERAVPADDRRWITRGRKVLTWDGTHGESAELTLRLVDIWENRDVWQRTFSGERGTAGGLARAFQIDNEEMVVMQPDGKLTVFRLDDGEVRLQAELLPEPQLNHIFAIRSRDQYLFITNQPVPKRRVSRRGVYLQNRNISLGPVWQINGRVYAFDRETLEPSWSVPAEIDGYMLPLAQAVNSPMLFFMRYPTKQLRVTSGGRQRIQSRQHTELLCLDRRDGRLLARNDAILGSQALHRIEVDPQRRNVVVELRGRRGLVLDFTDKPRPPAAPLQSGYGSSSASGNLTSTTTRKES